MSATKRGDLPGVQALLAGGAGANFCDAADEENGAIYWAGVKGKTSVLRCLLENGGDVNLPNRKGNTVLIMSSLFNHIDTVALELQKGADPNITNNDGWSPLMLACEKGNNGSSHRCCATRASTSTACAATAARPSRRRASTARRDGANARDEQGHRDQPLRQGRLDTSAHRGGKGAHHTREPILGASNRNKVSRLTSLLSFSLTQSSPQGHQQVVRVLLSDPSVDRHLPNAKGKTPLQTATDKGHTSIADMLRR